MDYPILGILVVLVIALVWLRLTGAKAVLALRRQIAIDRNAHQEELNALLAKHQLAYDHLASDRDTLQTRRDWLEVAMGESKASEADLRVQVAQRDEKIAHLTRLLSKDYRGRVHLFAIRHRGKGGFKPIIDEEKPIEGRFFSHRIQDTHPSGDVYDLRCEVKLGLDDAEL